ncbi:hypothetical protein Tco_0947522, partial [Tanacetum coccineum]
EEKLVISYVLKMKGYVGQLECIGYVLLQDLSVGLIMNGLTSDFARFVRNYNTHNMGKTLGELHALLIEYEKGLPKKDATPQVMAIQGGRIQKANKKSLNAKGKGKGKGKGKDKSNIPKPKNPKPFTKENPIKDDARHHCKEVGHWKMNYLVYLAELVIKMKQVGTANSSGLGCEALVKKDKPDKLKQRSVKSEFMEKNIISQEFSGRAVELEEIQDEDISPSKNTSEIPLEVEGFEPPQDERVPIRRSTRTHRAPDRLCLNVEVEEHSLGDLNEPTNYKATILDPKSDKWLDAMNAEMQSMKDNQVWCLVDLSPNAIEVEKVNLGNRKMKETNADLTTELASHKNQEKCFEINQEKYDKLERCYQKFVYQEQCLTKRINALHLSSAKTITTLNEEIANLNNQLSKEKSTVSFLHEEKKKLKKAAKFLRDFKSLAKEADESFAKHKALEYEIERLSKAVVPPKVVESNDLAHPVTSNSVPTTKESKVVKNDKVIALGMFRINPFNTSRKDKFVPINQARASVRTKSVAVSQPQVVNKKDVNSDSNSSKECQKLKRENDAAYHKEKMLLCKQEEAGIQLSVEQADWRDDTDDEPDDQELEAH